MEQSKQSNKVLIGIVVAVVLVVITAAVVMVNGKKEPVDTAINSTNQASDTNSSAPSPTTAGSYKDGSYKADGSYQSPGGSEMVHVTVTLKDGAITEAAVETDATGSTAKSYQNQFIADYKALVVGKKIDEVSLDRVAGSSLTSGGFNRALEIIKNDARA